MIRLYRLGKEFLMYFKCNGSIIEWFVVEGVKWLDLYFRRNSLVRFCIE